MPDQTYNQKLLHALTGRRLRDEAPLRHHMGRPLFRLWGADAGIPEGDIHHDRVYQIYLELDGSRRITGAAVAVAGELISPCSGYREEALDQFDFQPILSWCLRQTEA